MELTNANNNFDPTPNFKSNSVPILFIPFNKSEYKCNYCGINYSYTRFSYQPFCKNCLTHYINNAKNINSNDIYLDVLINTNNTRCCKHETIRNPDFIPRSIQEWCEYCSEISFLNKWSIRRIIQVSAFLITDIFITI